MKTAWWCRVGIVAWLGLSLTGVAAGATAGGSEVSAAAGDGWRSVALAFSAALAIGLSVLGAGYAVARVGAAALGTAAERPELMMRSLMFVALAEGLAVLGFAVAMLLLQKI
jgi:V/A-type H+-transporting ATPase subunit K